MRTGKPSNRGAPNTHSKQTRSKNFLLQPRGSDLAGVSIDTVQQDVETGLLKALKTSGGHRRVLRESIHRLLHQGPDLRNPRFDTMVPMTALDTPRQMRVLAVDDDPLMRNLYQTKISAWSMAPETRVADSAVLSLMMVGH